MIEWKVGAAAVGKAKICYYYLYPYICVQSFLKSFLEYVVHSFLLQEGAGLSGILSTRQEVVSSFITAFWTWNFVKKRTHFLYRVLDTNIIYTR